MKNNNNKQNEGQSRRSFVKTSALVTGGLMAAPLGVSGMAHVHNEKK